MQQGPYPPDPNQPQQPWQQGDPQQPQQPPYPQQAPQQGVPPQQAYPPQQPYPPQQGGYVPSPGEFVPPQPGYADPNMAGYGAPPMGMPVEHPVESAAEISEHDRQKTRITAFIVAALVHVVIVAILVVMIVATVEEPEPILTAIAAPNEVENTQVVEFNQSRKQSKPAKSSASAKLITSSSTTTFNVPLVETENTTGIGFGDDYGDGMGLMGDGAGGGPNFAIPKVVRGRCDAADRKKRLRENGGTPECEEAVMKALRWLKETQSEEGSWGASHKHAMTGLAILAFLGHCETTDSKEFGDTVTKAITWLTEEGLKKDGKLADNIASHHWVYEHGIAAYALAESYTMTKGARRRIPQLRQIVLLATKRIIDSQNGNGGWYYAYEQMAKSDTSVTGWQFQAVKAATYTKLPIDDMKECINKAADYLESAQVSNGAFGYHNASGARYSMTGIGVLGLQMAGRGTKKAAKKGIDFILDTTKKNKIDYAAADADLYAWYYNTLALFQRGKGDWNKWNGWFRDEILSGQAEDGSFNPEGGAKTNNAGGGITAQVYRTCLCTLMLEVYYRYLPTGR